MLYSKSMAAAVTPLLFIETDVPLSIPHVYANDSGEAAQAISDGVTVLVPTEEMAISALMLLGLDETEAKQRLAIATSGLNFRGEADPAAPVPLAPGAELP